MCVRASSVCVDCWLLFIDGRTLKSEYRIQKQKRKKEAKIVNRMMAKANCSCLKWDWTDMYIMWVNADTCPTWAIGHLAHSVVRRKQPNKIWLLCYRRCHRMVTHNSNRSSIITNSQLGPRQLCRLQTTKEWLYKLNRSRYHICTYNFDTSELRFRCECVCVCCVHITQCLSIV